MTISTKNFEIPLVSVPLFESAHPTVLAVLWLFLLCAVYMIYVENSNISVPALAAFAAKFGNQSEFPVPDSFFGGKVAMFVPVFFLAFFGTKASFRFLVALLAFAATPSRRHVALGAAITAIAFVQKVLMDFKFVFAMATGSFLRCARLSWNSGQPFVPRVLSLSEICAPGRTKRSARPVGVELGFALFAYCLHDNIISKSPFTCYVGIAVQRYFDIAVKRIQECEGKGSLFEAVKPEPVDMFS